MMKKLLLALTLIGFMPQISAMDQEFDPNLSVAETQARICARNTRILEQRKAENNRIEASRKKMYSAIFAVGLVGLCAAKIACAINNASNEAL